jgi:hypothetical protein
MVDAVEHPGIRYVVYPVHLNGMPTGAQPRLRPEDGKTGGLCPTCNQTMPLTGVCDNCS